MESKREETGKRQLAEQEGVTGSVLHERGCYRLAEARADGKLQA
jgi:hypothetical protein